MLSSNPNSQFSNLALPNGTQQVIIKSILKFYFDDIAEELRPNEATKALQLMSTNPVLPEEIEYYKIKGVWNGAINDVRKILKHPCPQNRRVGSYQAASGALGNRAENSDLLDGIIDGQVYYFNNGSGTGARHEPRGLLGLTARQSPNDPPITKAAVVNFIQQLINREIQHYNDIVTANKEAKVNQDENLSVKSTINPKLNLTLDQMAVCIAKCEKTKYTMLYLEGVRKSGTRFLDRYQLTTDFAGRILVRAESLNPVDFWHNDFHLHQSFSISTNQGARLKSSIKEEVYKNFSLSNVSVRVSNAQACLQDANSDYTANWAKAKLEQIQINVDLAEFKEAGRIHCAIL